MWVKSRVRKRGERGGKEEKRRKGLWQWAIDAYILFRVTRHSLHGRALYRRRLRIGRLRNAGLSAEMTDPSAGSYDTTLLIMSFLQ